MSRLHLCAVICALIVRCCDLTAQPERPSQTYDVFGQVRSDSTVTLSVQLIDEKNRRVSEHRVEAQVCIVGDSPSGAAADSPILAPGNGPPLLYDNSIHSFNFLRAEPGEELLDFGSSAGGYVNAIEVGYATELIAPGPLRFRIYGGSNTSTCPGELLLSLNISGLPGLFDGGFIFLELDLVTAGIEFTLPAGDFGYSYLFDPNDDQYIGAILSEGGSGSQDLLFLDCNPTIIRGDQHAGTYVRIFGLSGPVEPNLADTPDLPVLDCGGPLIVGDPNQPGDPNLPGDPNQLWLRPAQAMGDSLFRSQGRSVEVLDESMIDAAMASSTDGTAEIIVHLVEPKRMKRRVQWRRRHLAGRAKRDYEAFCEEIRFRQDRLLKDMPTRAFRMRHRYGNFTAVSASVNRATLRRLKRHPMVACIEPVVEVHPQLRQGLALMQAQEPREEFYGQGLSIAICDTGVDYTHPLLGGGGLPDGSGRIVGNNKVLGGFDFGDNDIDPIPGDDFASRAQGNSHGTSVAGIAAGGLADTGDYVGGVAHGAKIYALKISPQNGGSSDTGKIAAAYDWCVTNQFLEPNYPIMVINTSFGGGRRFSTTSGTATDIAAANAKAAGITVLASSGNDGYCDSMGAPASDENIISVGAVYDADIGRPGWCLNENSCAPGLETRATCSTGFVDFEASTAADQVTLYSNSADFLDVLAPSHHAYTLDISGTGTGANSDFVTTFGGTSAACPYAAGVVACLQSAALIQLGTFFSPDEVRDILVGTGTMISDGKAPSVVKPRVDLWAALQSITCSGEQLILRSDGVLALQVMDIQTPDWIRTNLVEPNFILEPDAFVRICVEPICTACNGSDPNGVIRVVTNDPDDPNGVRTIAVTTACPVCPVFSDLTDDCQTTLDDWSVFQQMWLWSRCTEPDWCRGADYDRNGRVSAVDLHFFFEQWLLGAVRP